MPLIEGPAPLFFAHIPKCAGSSIHAAFEPQYAKEHVFLTGAGAARANFLATPCRFLQQLKYCGGHLTDFDCMHKLGAAKKLTTIREPLTRLQSIMNHSIRGDWLDKTVFEEFRDGSSDRLVEYLDERYYFGQALISYHVQCYRLENTDLEALSDVFVGELAARTAAEYSLVLAEEDIDNFVAGVSPKSQYPVEQRRMVGAELGEYVNFKDKFDDRIRSLLEPDCQFYERLVQSRENCDIRSLERQRRSWILDWDLPVECNGFTLRRQASVQTSVVKEFTSRLFAKHSASIHVCGLPDKAPCSFSGLLRLQAGKDLEALRLQLNGQEVEFKTVNLSPQEWLFYGELESHPSESEWQFSFSSEPKSNNIWFNDFSVHALSS